MANRLSKYLWLILIALCIFIWLKRDDLFLILGSRPSAESLEFNKPRQISDSRPIIMSKDEEINKPITKNDRATNVTEHAKSILFFFIQITCPFLNSINLKKLTQLIND